MTLLSRIARENLSSIFNERDQKKRRSTLRKLWAVDAVLWTADGTYVGRSAVEKAVASALRRYPEFDFVESEETDEIPDVARMNWSFGAAGAPPAITGLDVIVVSAGLIVAMYRFLDGAEL